MRAEEVYRASRKKLCGGTTKLMCCSEAYEDDPYGGFRRLTDDESKSKWNEGCLYRRPWSPSDDCGLPACAPRADPGAAVEARLWKTTFAWRRRLTAPLTAYPPAHLGPRVTHRHVDCGERRSRAGPRPTRTLDANRSPHHCHHRRFPSRKGGARLCETPERDMLQDFR